MPTTSHSRTSTMLGMLMGAAIVLSACAFPLPTAAPARTSEAQPSAEISAGPTSIAAPTRSAGPSTSTTPRAGGSYGAFPSMSEACISVSATMLSVTILPLSALVGGNPEDIEKAKQELSQMQGKVPDELKPHFEKLRAFTEAAGTDFSKYGDPEFERLVQPIQDWMDKNCK